MSPGTEESLAIDESNLETSTKTGKPAYIPTSTDAKPADSASSSNFRQDDIVFNNGELTHLRLRLRGLGVARSTLRHHADSSRSEDPAEFSENVFRIGNMMKCIVDADPIDCVIRQIELVSVKEEKVSSRARADQRMTAVSFLRHL